MISPTWIRFHWKTTTLPSSPKLDSRLTIRSATAAEQNSVLKVILLALAMNTDWYDMTEEVQALIEAGIKKSFVSDKEPSCFVATHGSRIIATSLLDCSSETTNHVMSGPWIYPEYRNRGVGTALLWSSLQQIAERGITSAFGMTRKNSIAAQFVYPKFGGTIEDLSTPIQKELIF
jgi:N-acetylglutamate synthase-like GNAT family acetyltransferase